MFRLRPFQRRAVDLTHECLDRVRSALLVMATGLGKTPTSATLAFERQRHGRILFLCHRDELVRQAVRTFDRVFGRRPDVQQGEERGDMYTASSPVVVSTVQTQYSGYDGRGRMSLFDPMDFGTVIVDECFPAGTLIDGRPIETIRPGDYVQCFDHNAFRLCSRRVVRVFARRPATKLLRVTLADRREVVCTPEHPFYDPSSGRYRPACQLNRDDVVYSIIEMPKGCNNELSPDDDGQGEGRKERRRFAFARVDRIEILEPSSDGRFERLCPDGFVYNLEVEEFHNYFANGILVHNCHHYVAPAYKRVVEYYQQNPALKVVGLTATPDRADKLAMGRLFEAVACNYDIRFGVDHSWLVPIEQYTGRLTDLDLSDVGVSKGDLNADELSDVMCRRKNLYGVADKTIERVGDRRTLVFATPGGGEASDGQKIKHAHLLTAILNQRVPPKNGIAQAHYVHEKTPKEDRRAMFAAFGRGAFQFLVNVGIATEGFDDPGVECVVVARPTMSRALYTQMAGRATRPIAQCVDPYPTDEEEPDRRVSIAESAKPCCELIDFEGNAGRHKLITSVDILGGDYDSDVIARAKLKSATADEPLNVRDLLDASRLEIEREKQSEADRLAQLRFNAGVLWENVDPFGRAGSNAPDRRKTATAATGARSGPPSASQLEFLTRHAPKNLDPSTLNMGEAGKLIGDIKRRFKLGLCSIAQSEVLKRNGLPGDVDRSTAKHWLDRLAQNKWRVPPDVKAQAAATLATQTH